MNYNESAKGLAGYQWNLGATKNVIMEQLWAWAKLGAINGVGDLFTGPERCNYFEKELWFELGNTTWRKHRRKFKGHVKNK